MHKTFAALAVAALSISACAITGLSNPHYYRSSTVEILDSTGHGSGVVIGSHTILTAAHVVAGNTKMDVKFSNGDTEKGTVVFTNSTFDIAELKVEKLPKWTSVAPINCSPLVWGQSVTIVGFPLGVNYAVTQGVVASVNDMDKGKRPEDAKLVPLDAIANFGNSGGPVFNSDGEVIGLVDAFINSRTPPYGGQSGMSLMSAASNWCKVLPK